MVVLPLLLTAAYHSGTDIPGVLAEATAGLPGLGSGTASRWDRIRDWCGRWSGASPRPARIPAATRSRTAVVLASAGSSQPSANAAIARMAADWQADRGWLAVRPAYASAAAPTPAEAVADLLRGGAERVVVASYLLAPGLFADRIRESSLAAGAAAVSAPLGAAPDVADVLLDRYLQAAAGGLSPGDAVQRRDSRVSAR